MVPSGAPEVNLQTKQVHRRLRQPEVEKLVAGYLGGATVYRLGEEFGIHRTTVSKLLEREGVGRRNRPLSATQVADAIELYSSGKSLVAVGELLGVHPSTIWMTLKREGIKRRDCQRREL